MKKLIYLLHIEKCGKCNNLSMAYGLIEPFCCIHDPNCFFHLPKYVPEDFMGECQNFDEKTNTSAIKKLDFAKEAELYYKIMK